MFGVAFLVAVLDWIAVGLNRKALEYVFKPATLAAITIGVLLLMQGPHDEWQGRLFVIGLIFSLAGDVFLMLPGEGLFLPGLVSFLFAHICYIAGLNSTLPPLPSALFLIPVGVIGASLYVRIAAGLRASDKTNLVVPVAVYSCVISLMLFSAWATLMRPEWTLPRRALVIAGASLFFASDAMLAWNRFVRPFSAAKLGVIITYHLGQLALASSIAKI